MGLESGWECAREVDVLRALRAYEFLKAAHQRAVDRYYDGFSEWLACDEAERERRLDDLNRDGLLLNAIRFKLERAEQLVRQLQAVEAEKRAAEKKSATKTATRRKIVARRPEPVADIDRPSLPVPIAEVPSIPKSAVHVLEHTVHNQAERLVDWNYFSLESSRRRKTSRRYEGYAR